MQKTKIICNVILIMFPLFGFAQDILNDFEKILIRNVTVIDQDGESEDVVVSILIEQKELELISQDKIPISEADITLDAKGGFVLGKLEVGMPAGFIILDQDPRTNVDVILDTRTYAVFAVSKGEVVLNKLIRIDVELNEQVSSWQTYAPPPVALPLSYQNKRKWNIFRTKLITIVLGGAILMENTRWLSQDQTNMEQVEDLGQFEGGSVRGFRAGVGGTFNFEKPWTYLFTFGTRAFERGFEQGNLDEFVLYDYNVGIPLGLATLSIGKQKETISLSRLSAMIYEPGQQERASVADGLLPARNIGVVINGTMINERMTWAAGVFNNWFEEGR
jgi:phosphate-selective porin OprO/OprP